jgi:hypothetical protein
MIFEITLLAQSKPAPRKASNLITFTSSLHLTAKDNKEIELIKIFKNNKP